jgi:CRP-like cAMP-binding protein
MSDTMNNMFERFGVTYKPGEIIFCEYEPGENFYLIQSGKVRVTKVAEGKEKTLDIFTSGDMFGEMALLENAPRTATAIAEEETKALQFNKENFDVLLNTNQQIAIRLLKVLARRIYEAKRRLMILILDNKEIKIMDTLLMLGETAQNIHPDQNEPVEIKTTVQDIARWCAENVKETKKILSHYEKLGKISIKGQNFIIENPSELYRIVASKRRHKNQ